MHKSSLEVEPERLLADYLALDLLNPLATGQPANNAIDRSTTEGKHSKRFNFNILRKIGDQGEMKQQFQPFYESLQGEKVLFLVYFSKLNEMILHIY